LAPAYHCSIRKAALTIEFVWPEKPGEPYLLVLAIFREL
jgi:hypothetical protein